MAKKPKELYNEPRYDAMEDRARILVEAHGQFGMTRELALIAMQEWNRYLGNEFMYGNIDDVQRMVSYYDQYEKKLKEEMECEE